MARLAAVEKALYYPTPERVTQLIADAVRWEGNPDLTGRLLDPCAGEGTAAATLASAWGLQAFGVELDAGRAALAATKMPCRHGSYHQLAVPERSFSALYLNPPYDLGEDDGVSIRQEVQFLQDCTRWLAPGGLLVFVVPERIVASRAYQEYVKRNYQDVRVLRFPLPEFEQFRQVVVFARRTANAWSYALADVPDPMPVLGEQEPLSVYRPPLPPLADFRLDGIDPVSLAPSWEPVSASWGYGSTAWDLACGHRGGEVAAPLTMPRPGHRAMLLAAGALDGCEVGGKLLKGGSTKITTQHEEPSGEPGMVTLVERERIVSRLAVLDLTTGECESWRVDQEPEKTAAWFAEHGADLARAIREAHRPAFNGDMTPYQATLARLRAPGILPGRDKPEILGIQAETAAAVAYRWRKHKSVTLSGEMGVGKTTCATVACELAGHRRTIIICPSHLVRKWVREIETITGTRGIAVIGKRLADVDAFFNEAEPDVLGLVRPQPKYLVLSKEIAKLGSRWEPRYRTRTVVIEKEIPDYDARPAYSSYGYSYYNSAPVYPKKMVRERLEVVTCPDCGCIQEVGSHRVTPKEMTAKDKRTCTNKACRAPLWQYTPITSRGTKRWPLARYINRHYPRRYALVIDEAHQHARGDSDQALAVQQLVSASTKVLGMTGTLYGGRASSIFYLLFRLDPTFRVTYGYTECDRFVAHHGLFEARTEVRESTSCYGYRRGRTGGRVREIPGVSPQLVTGLLAFTVFLKLKDLRLELPPYEEVVELIEPDPDILGAVRRLQQELRTVLRKHPRVLGQYLMAVLGYPDRPDQPEEIIDRDPETESETVLATAPAFQLDGRVLPKDRRVVEICQAEVTSGRKCLIFCAQTHRRDARGRLKALLEAEGLRVAVLDGSVAPEDREEWVSKHFPDRGRGAGSADVMICNPRLVETGLDLLHAATIIVHGTEYSIPSLRQATRRSWRLGQEQPVRVIYLAYANTMQATAMSLISRKMKAAEMVDGDEAGGLASHDSGGDDILLALAHEAVSALEE